MANADLERFMVERLLELDPSLSDSEGSRMFSVVIDPLVTRLGVDPIAVDVETFITERLKDGFPELDISSPGSTIKDTLVRPLILLIEPIRREIELLRTQRSLADVTVLAADELDALLANIFAERREGEFARGKVRVFFNAPRTVSTDNSIVFSTVAGLGFVAEEVRTFLPTDMQRSGNLVFIDVAIRSIEPTETANIGVNEIRIAQNLEGVVRVTNPEPIRFGVTTETNEAFSERADRSMTERSLNTDRGLQANLLSNFTDLVSVEAIGYGEPEMQRDILRADVEIIDDELIGSLVHMTASFMTEPAFNLGLSGLDSIVLPFTNLIRVKDPQPLATRTAIKGATFLRLADGNGHYQDTLISRVRRIVSVTDSLDTPVAVDEGDLIIRLADFEVFPENPNEDSPSTGGTVQTDLLEHGYNKYTVQGSSFRLTTSSGGVDYIVGAPLPFSDTCKLNIASTDRPGAVIFGRDFLVMAKTDVLYATAAHPLPSMLRVLPMDRLQGGNVLSVARADAMLVAKDRIAYPGQENFVYQPTPGVLAVTERTRLVDFGAPKYTETDLAVRYGGVQAEVWGRNPGVALGAEDRALGVWNPATVEAKYFKVTLEPTQVSWAVRGVAVGQFISLSVFRSITDPVPDGAHFDGTLADSTTHLRWHVWGQITEIVSPNTIRMRGADVRSLIGIAAAEDKAFFNTANGGFPPNPYRVAWAVYEGQHTLVAPDGRIVTSYDDFGFLPAYKMGGAPGEVAAPYVSGFRGREFDTQVNEPVTTASHKVFWIRLERPFLDVLPSLAVPAPQLTEDGSVVFFATGDPIDEVYQEDKYPTFEAIELADPGLPGPSAPVLLDGLVQAVANPETEGALSFAPLDADAWPPKVDHLANSKQLLGFLLPHPMGSAHTDPGEDYEGVLVGEDTLQNQVLQFYGNRAEELDFDAKITVSDIPGSVPFPGQFAPGLVVNDDEVHIGGLTDVYVKMSAETSRTTEQIILTPRDLENPLEVLFEGVDGSIDFDNTPQDFLSPALVAFVEDRFDITGAAQLHNLAVQLVEVPPEVSPQSFRILNNIVGGVRIEGSFTGLLGQLPNLRFRLVQQLTTDLERPFEVLQQGSDLVVETGAFQAKIPSGIDFLESVTARGLLLVIDIGPNQGEYPITSKGAVTLGVSTAFLAAESAVPFRVVALQTDRVEVPLVRAVRVSLTGAAEGIAIPYKFPVDIEASSFAGLNNDPLTDDDPSLDEGTLFSDGINPATFSIRDPGGALIPTPWPALGLLRFDVLRLDGVPDDLRYWYIEGVDEDETGAVSVGTLRLSRVVPSVQLDLIGFTVGHPSLGTATVRFQERTFFEVDQAATFSFVNAGGATFRFRPSPAESSTMFASSQVEAVVTVDGGTPDVLDFAGNVFAHGVEIGDRVDVLSEVLESSPFVAPAAVPVAGKSLVMSFDDVRRVVVFTGTAPLTLSQMAADINRQLSDVMRATATATSLRLHTKSDMRLLDEGSAGILDQLQFAVGNRESKGALNLFASFSILSMTFDPVLNISHITIDAPTVVEDIGLFIDIVRLKLQRFYPGNMVEEGTGLFSVEVTLSSFDPLEQDIIESGQPLQVIGERSFGYELVVDNDNYSYSMGELVAIRCTPVILGELDVSLTETLTTVGARVTIEYDRAPQIASIQDHMLLRSIRVQCHNPLVRHFFPAYPVFELTYSGNVPVVRVEETIKAFLNTLFPNRPLRVFELLGRVEKLGITNVTLPQQVGFLVHNANRRREIVRSLDVVVLGDQTHIMGNLDLVTVTKR